MDTSRKRNRVGVPDPEAQRAGALPFREAPHNLEAEKALLGAILVSNEAHDRVSGFLEPHHFYDPLHQQIYETAAKLITSGVTVTPVTLRTFFEQTEPISGIETVPQYLGHLAANATTIVNARDYGRTVHDLATRRQLILIGEDMVNVAFDSPVDFPSIQQIEEAETRLHLAAEAHPDRRTVSGSSWSLDDIEARDSTDDLWDGVIGRGDVGTVFAVSQAGKGFWLGELAKCMTLGKPMFGRKTRPTPVLQIQYEGGRGLHRRVWAAAADLTADERAAFSRRYRWVTTPPTLGRGAAGDRGEAEIIRHARDLEKRAGEPVGFITIDTTAKALAGESLNNDDAVGLLHARCRRIAAATGAAVATVGHPGHGSKERPGGSYQLIGSPDFVIKIDVDAPGSAIAIPMTARRTVVGEKIKDGESGLTLGTFTLRLVEVWSKEDGRPETSCVVVAATEASTEAKAPPRKAALKGNRLTMFMIIREAGPRGIPVDVLNEQARLVGIGTNRKADLWDLRTQLKREGFIYEGINGWCVRTDPV